MDNLDTVERLVAAKDFDGEGFRASNPLLVQWYAAHPDYVDSMTRIAAARDAEERRERIISLLVYVGLFLLAGIAGAAAVRAMFKAVVWVRGSIEPAGHAVKSWHAGQLAAAWVATLLIEGMLYTWFRLAFDEHENGWQTSFFPLPFIALVYVGILAAMLRITWVWFGGRAESEETRRAKDSEANTKSDRSPSATG